MRRFFMYGEDIDLSYRIQQEGYKNFYFAETSIIHFKGESTKKGSLNYVKLFYKAMSLFVDKHFKGQNSVAFNFLIGGAIWLRAGLSATRNVFVSNKPPSNDSVSNTLIIATEAEVKKIEAILAKQTEKRNLLKLEVTENWKQFVQSNIPHEIIFGDEYLTYKEIINSMQQLPNDIAFSIYSDKAQNIVGSSSKNNNGYILA